MRCADSTLYNRTGAAAGCSLDHTALALNYERLQSVCGRQYVFRVRELCTKRAATSAWSNASATTFDAPACATTPGEATQPTNLTATQASPVYGAANLTWTPGQARSCDFKAWEVRHRVCETRVSTQEWAVVEGCAIVTRTVSSCIATGLPSSSCVEFTVSETCGQTQWYSKIGTTERCIATLITSDLF